MDKNKKILLGVAAIILAIAAFFIFSSRVPEAYEGLVDEKELAKYSGKLLAYDKVKLGDDGLIHEAESGAVYTGRIYNKDGQNTASLVYDVKAGKRDGVYHVYYPNGKYHTKMTYKEGKILTETGYFDDGTHVQYDYQIDGTKGIVTQYKDKEGHKEVVTNFRFGDETDPDGALLREGKQTEYYVPQGNVRTEIDYKDDLADGEVKAYYPNGQVKVTAQATTGYFNGPVRTYYSNGNLKEYIEFVSGVVEGNTEGYTLSGLYQHYKTDGTLIEEKNLDDVHISAPVPPPSTQTATANGTAPADSSGTPAPPAAPATGGATTSAPATTTTTTDSSGNVTVINNYEDNSDDEAATILTGAFVLFAVGDIFYDDDYYYHYDHYPRPYPYPYPVPVPVPGPPGPPGPPGSHFRPGEGGSGTYHPPIHPAQRPEPIGRPGTGGGGQDRIPNHNDRPQREPIRPGSDGGGVERQRPQPGADGSGVQRERPQPGAAGGGIQHERPQPGAGGGGTQQRVVPQHNSPAANGGGGHGGGARSGGFHRR